MSMNQETSIFLAALIFIVFSAIALKGLFLAQPGDENVYYYMGRLVSEGYVPYKDFFYAHPPLQLYLIAAIFKLFGFNIFILKLIPLISTITAGFFLYLTAKNMFGNGKALISLALFLFSYSAMFNSVFSFGIELAVMFLMIGYYFYAVKNNLLIAGLFFGFAGISRFLSLIPIAIIIFLYYFKEKRRFFILSSGFLAVFLGVNLIFLFAAGSDYAFSAYKFHLLKGAEQFKFAEYLNVIKLNWILFFGFAAFVFAKENRQLTDFTIISAVYLVVMALMARVFNFYFMLAVPFMALIGGCCIYDILSGIKIRSKKYFFIILTLLTGIFLWNLVSDVLFLHKFGFEGFDRREDIKEFILLKSKPSTLLFGDSSTVPLMALMTGKKIALDIVDTNPAVFNTGAVNLGKTLEKLKGSEIIFLARNTEGISQFPEIRKFLNERCDLLSSFSDKLEGLYLVYKCN